MQGVDLHPQPNLTNVNADVYADTYVNVCTDVYANVYGDVCANAYCITYVNKHILQGVDLHPQPNLTNFKPDVYVNAYSNA